MRAGRAMSASDHSLASRWRRRIAPSVARTCSGVSLWANAICSAQNPTTGEHSTPRSRSAESGEYPAKPGEREAELLQVRGVEQVLAGPLNLLSRPHDLDQLLS